MDSIRKLMKLARFPSLFKYNDNNVVPSGACCLSIDGQTLSLAYTQFKDGEFELQVCESSSYTDDTLPFVLSSLVKQYHLEGAHCTWILAPDKYQLLLLEELPVPAAEFQAAIRWKIKELSTFPVEDSIIDYFPIPIAKTHNSKKMMMVVIAQGSYLQMLASLLAQSELVLTAIDIPEMAMRNITALYEKDDIGTVLLYMQENATNVVITREKIFYTSRRLEFGQAFFSEAENIESNLDILALEIQRSSDYYQSQWRYPAPSRMLLATQATLPADFSNSLSERLMVPIQLLDLQDVLVSKQVLNKNQQGQFLPVIGGALRERINNSVTTG
jgi:MSHA biogenesis protein MshI